MGNANTEAAKHEGYANPLVRILDIAEQRGLKLTADEAHVVMNSRHVVEHSYPHRLLTLLAAAPEHFVDRDTVYNNAAKSTSSKTRYAVIDRLVKTGLVERGYHVTPAGLLVLSFAVQRKKPL